MASKYDWVNVLLQPEADRQWWFDGPEEAKRMQKSWWKFGMNAKAAANHGKLGWKERAEAYGRFKLVMLTAWSETPYNFAVNRGPVLVKMVRKGN